MKPAISVVIPMLNEAPNVATVLADVEGALLQIPHETIIVDDGSTDGTGQRVRAFLPSVPALRLLTHSRPRGQSTAVWNGVQAARAPLVAVLDGDGQNDPADLPGLLAVMKRESRPTGRPPLGMVMGHRVRRRDTAIRRLSSRIANTVRRWILRDSTPDSGCGIKLVRRAVFLELPYFDHMHRFMPALVQQAGYRVMSVPVSHRPRQAGHSKYGISNRLWAGLVDLLGVAWLARRNRRTTCVEIITHAARERVSS